MTKYPWESLTRRQSLELLGMFTAAAAFPGTLQAKEPSFPQGAIIRTVLKDLAPADLASGTTLFHEHIQRRSNKTAPADEAAASDKPARKSSADKYADAMSNSDVMAAEVAKVKANGIVCMVDGGHPDMGRDVRFLREVSQKSGVAIVAGGGYYLQSTYPPELATMSEDDVVKDLIKQADDDTLGAFGEIGSSDEIAETEQKVFRAVGRAHVETNIPIFTHTTRPGKMAVEQLDIFEKVGVKPNHVVIGHLGDLLDPNVAVQKEICKRGAFIGFDRQGYGDGDNKQVPLVLSLIEAGYADNLMFSSDTTGNGFSRAVTGFVPKLKAAGVSDDILHGILVNNPRRFLAFVPKRPRKA